MTSASDSRKSMTIRQLINTLEAKIASGIPETMEVWTEGCADVGECARVMLWSQFWQGPRKVDPEHDFLLLARDE